MLHLLLLSQLASAWETDPITGRAAPLRDSTDAANAFADALIKAAVHHANQQTGCAGSDEKMRDALAAAIYRATSPRDRVEDRPGLAGEGHGIYSGWLEQAPEVDRRSFDDRSDLFGGIPFSTAPVLSSAGTCSIVRLAGITMGTDKPDHFWYSGYWYYDIARKQGPARAIEYGTRTELTYYGMMTSSTFSFADLHANWRGWQFYDGLLREGSVVQRDPGGCLVQTGRFDWADWADWRWDEILNPNVYTTPVTAWVDRTLTARQGAVCRDVADALPDVATRVPLALSEPTPWAGRKAPARVDPFALTRRCTPQASADASAPAPSNAHAAGQ